MYDVVFWTGGTGQGNRDRCRTDRNVEMPFVTSRGRGDRALLVLGLGDWGRGVLSRVQQGRDRPAACEGFTTLQIDHASATVEDSTAWEQFYLGLPRSFDPTPHVWMPSHSLAETPFELGTLPDRARARLVLSTSQRQLRGFLSLPIHRLVSNLDPVEASSLEVLVCASLSDVMGSGVFIDLAYILRELVAGEHSASVCALLAFPDARALAEDDPTLWQARTYSGLVELNHFSGQGVPFSLHDHLGKERQLDSGPPFDRTFLLFPEEGRWQPSEAEEEAAAWIDARSSGIPFLAALDRPRAEELPEIPPGPHRLDTFRGVRLKVPGTGMPQMTAIQLSRRALARWTRSGASIPMDAEGRRLVAGLRDKVARHLLKKESTNWLIDINQRCEALTRESEALLESSFDAGARAWRMVRRLERLVYADLDRGGKVWREARGQISARFELLDETIGEELNQMLARPTDGHLLLARCYDELQTMRNDRIRELTQRIEDMAGGEATGRLRAARTDLRQVTHSEPGLFGRLRGRADVKLMASLAEWVRWMPRFAMQERERACAQIEIEVLQEMLRPVERNLATARLWAEELGRSLDSLEQDLIEGVFEAPDDGAIQILPGGTTDPRQAARHLCEELLGLFPEAAELPMEITDPTQIEEGDSEEGARRLGRWAMPLCASVGDRLTIDAVLTAAPPGTNARQQLDDAVDRWLTPFLDHDSSEQTDAHLLVVLPQHALDSTLADWLSSRAAERGLAAPEFVGVAAPNEAVLYRVELDFPPWRLGHQLESLRRAYEKLRFDEEPVSLHTRADVPEWASLEREEP